jgi:hypothetical protein
MKLHADLRSITLDSTSLDRAVGVLSDAAKEFSLTGRERLRYQWLKFSLDMVVVTYLLMWVRGLFFRGVFPKAIFITAFVLSMIAVFACLLLNIPLLFRTLQDREKLRALGVEDVSRSLCKARQKHHRLGRLRSGLLAIVSLSFLVVGVVDMIQRVPWFENARSYLGGLSGFAFSVLILLVPAGLLFAAWHLRSQRQEIDMAANAQELAEALRSLRLQADAAGSIAVPTHLVEQAASVEATRIAENRQQAIIRGAGTRAGGYAIRFDEKAVKQRMALDPAERLALEDMLAGLSAGDAAVAGEAGAAARAICEVPDGGARTDGLEVEYVLDASTRGIRITAVNRVGASPANLSGVTDG